MGRNPQRILMTLCALALGAAVLAYGWATWHGLGQRDAALREIAWRDGLADLVLQATTRETAERGFVIAGDESFLQPYQGADAGVKAAIGRLDEMAPTLGLGGGTLDALRSVAEQQGQFSDRVVEVRRTEGYEPAVALVRSGEGRRLMEEIRAASEQLRFASLDRTEVASASRAADDATANTAFAVAAAAAVLLAFLAFRRQRQNRQTAAVLNNVLRFSPVGLGFVGPNLTLDRVNDALAGMTAPGADPLRNGDDIGRLFPGQEERARRLARAAIESGTGQLNVEFVLGGADPENERLLLASFYPLSERDRRRGEAGEDAACGLAVMDATGRHHAQRRLARGERRLRTLVDAAAAIVWSTSETGAFEEPQPAWERFTGQSFESYRGSGWLEAVHPDDRAETERVWGEALHEQRPYAVGHRLKRKDGAWRDMLVRAVPILGDDGTVEEWIGTHTDITETRAAEKKLDEANLQFKTIADNIPQLAWTATSKGEIFWYNRRWFEFTGTTLDEMRGYGWHKVHHPDHLERVLDKVQIEFAAGEGWQDVFPLRRHDGEYRWFLSQAVPVRDAEGRILRWFGTNTDITEQREAERELAEAKDAAEQANRAKSQFIANMSHELRTPLTAVIGYSEMMEEELEEIGESALLADLGKIKGNARHLLSLINDVLDLSKIEAERMDVFAETFDVALSVREVASTIEPLVAKKNNRLVLDLAEPLGEMHTDQVKLRQSLINLLSNASKFTENGTITLAVAREPATGEGGEEMIRFTVRDSGIGMSEEQLGRLFQRFTQADASTTRKFGGTGLGLAITRAFSELMGGSIAVESVEGEGSTFTIRLPARLPEPEAALADEAGVPESERRASAGLVLVVDDDPHMRDLLTRFLEREGFLVRLAADGAAGLELAGALKPDAILLDVTMPRLDGWTVLSRLKADPALADIPVVMLTNLDEPGLGSALGAADYLVKPVEWSRLKRALETHRRNPDGYVLAVDDDRDALERMRRLMERENLKVTLATDGAEGLARMNEALPDLVLLDLVMPGMDGFSFLKALRDEPRFAEVPVLVLTSKDLSAEERAFLSRDAEQVIQKGQVDLRSLARQIRKVTAGDLPPEAVAAAPMPAPAANEE